MLVSELIDILKRCDRRAEIRVSFINNLQIRGNRCLAGYETNTITVATNKQKNSDPENINNRKVVIIAEAR